MKDNLPKLIRLYAFIIHNEIDLGIRKEVHNLICNYLHINKNEFRPFEKNEITEIPSYVDCICIIQAEINLLKRQKKI